MIAMKVHCQITYSSVSETTQRKFVPREVTVFAESVSAMMNTKENFVNALRVTR